MPLPTATRLKSWRRLGGGAIATLLAGCGALAPPALQPPLPDPPAHFHRVSPQQAVPAPQTAPQEAVASPLLAHYPALRELFAAVRAANPEREAAAARWAQAVALAEAARAQANGVTFGLTASASRSQASRELRGGAQVPVLDQTQLGGELRWDPDPFGRNQAAARAAALRAEAAEWELARLERALLLEAARAYFEGWAVQELLALNAAQQEVVAKSAELVAARVAAGLAGERERAQVETLRAQLAAQQAQLAGRLAVAEERLALLTGGTRWPVDRPPRSELPAALSADLPADLLRRRPEVAAAERRLAAVVAEAVRAQAARYPAFPLAGTLALAATNPAAMWQMSAAAWSLAANLSVTLFDGGRLAAEADAAAAAVREAAANYRQAVVAAVAEVEQAAAALAANDARRQALSAAAVNAERAWRLVAAQYEAGLVDYALVLEAQRTWLTAQTALQEAVATSRSDRLQWEYALGVVW